MFCIVSASESNTDSLVGSLVGEYRIVELRSDGTHYAIFRGTHSKLERQAEVRVHHLEHCDDAMHTRLEQTARVISRIRHANVVELYDYGRLNDGRAYVVREWIEGTLLRDNTVPLSPEETARLLAEVCAGLAVMHQVGLAHGELSRSAVMLSKEGKTAKIVGPLLDRSPEQRSAASVQGDIYSLGALIQELFGASMESVADGGEPLVPRDIDAIVKKCHAGSDEEHYCSVISVAQALEEALSASENRDDGLAPGTLIGDTYRVYAVIGSGGMGKVYEAVHKRLPQRVAIKVISGEHQPESLARFRQEAEIASSVGHPHIVRVFDFNALPDGRPYMVMEFLEGEDLAKTLGRGAVPAERALVIAGQVGSALSAAHAKGIVHRDLKPPNIFLGSVEIGGERREHATVLDFGVSKKVDAEDAITQTSAIIGTPRYMAPEQAMGRHDEVGPLSDQFALGCIVYEMLSGRRCFGGRDLAEIVHSVCYVDPIPLAEVQPDLASNVTSAVARAMSKSPSKRFPSMAEFVAALEGRTLKADPGVVESSLKLAREDVAGDDATVRAGQPDAATIATVASRPSSRKSELRTPENSETNTVAPKSATVAEAQDSNEAGRRALFLGAVAATLMAVAFVAYQAKKDGGSRSQKVDGGVAAIVQPQPPDASVAFDARAAIPSDAYVIEQQGSTIAAASALDASPKTPKAARVHRGAHSKEVASVLEKASALLASGKYASARRTLSQSPRAAKTSRGYAITVMSFCGEHNFGAATDWIARVARADRRRVRQYCKSRHGVEL